MWRPVLAAAIMTSACLVLGQQDVSECQGRCNLALCLQVKDSADTVETNKNIASALARSAMGSDASCEGNLGLAFYGKSIGINDTCPMWPHPPNRRPVLECANRVASHQILNTSQENALHICLDFIYTDESFLGFSHSEKCRYTVVVVADRQLQNPVEVQQKAKKLKNKGCAIHCFLVGNTQIAYDPMYSIICANITEASDFPNLWRGVETMYAFLDCCDDPIPTIPPPGQVTPCDGCKIVNGVGYNPHPSRCDCWNRCLFKGTQVTSVENCCHCGMFWSQDLLTCVPASEIACTFDQCRKAGVRAYAYAGNCRAFWNCLNSASTTAVCCPEGEEFNSVSQQCETDNNGDCTDPCPCDVETTTRICPFQPNPLDELTYFVPMGGNSAPELMPCPPGTKYDPADCKCSTFLFISQPSCPVDFDLRCTEDPLVDHANRAFITNFNVTIDGANGRCVFDNDEHLMVPRFANYDWRSQFAIYSSFIGSSSSNNNAPLVSNTDCKEPSSVELRLIRGAGNESRIEAYIKTTNGTFSTAVDYLEGQQNEAYMTYDGAKLKLCVKYVNGTVGSSEVDAFGLVLRCKCAMQIGYGWPNRYFTGIILDTRLYINCIPKNFCL